MVLELVKDSLRTVCSLLLTGFLIKSQHMATITFNGVAGMVLLLKQDCTI